MLIVKAKFIRRANVNGIKKMIRNILALQQSIKTITSDSRGADFERAKRYYSLFFKSPNVSITSNASIITDTLQKVMLEGIKAKQEFSFDEYHAMLKLQCGVDDSSGSQASDKNYGMHLIDLQRMEMESSNDDDGR